MPKLKSHSGAKKRFFKTASGKWRHQKANKRHLLTPSSGNPRRSLDGKRELPKAEGKWIARYLPYA